MFSTGIIAAACWRFSRLKWLEGVFLVESLTHWINSRLRLGWLVDCMVFMTLVRPLTGLWSELFWGWLYWLVSIGASAISSESSSCSQFRVMSKLGISGSPTQSSSPMIASSNSSVTSACWSSVLHSSSSSPRALSVVVVVLLFCWNGCYWIYIMRFMFWSSTLAISEGVTYYSFALLATYDTNRGMDSADWCYCRTSCYDYSVFAFAAVAGVVLSTFITTGLRAARAVEKRELVWLSICNLSMVTLVDFIYLWMAPLKSS